MSLRAAALGVMVARGLGLASAFAFSVYVAHRFGSDRSTDVAFAALAIPQALLIMAGTLFPPVFASAFKSLEVTRGPDEAWSFGRSAPLAVGAVAAALAAAGALAAPLLAQAVAGPFGAADAGRVAEAMRLAFALVLFTGVASVLKGILNAAGSLVAPSLETLVMNATAIAVIAATAARWGAFSIVAGITAGGFAKVLLMLPGYLARRKPGRGPWVHPALRESWGPITLYCLLFMLQVGIGRALAARVEGGEGAVSYLTYAEKIFSAPQDLFIVSLGIVLLPVMAEKAAAGDLAELRRLSGAGLRLSFFFGIPAAVGLVVLAEPVVQLVFQHGRFDDRDAARTALVLRAFSPSLAFSGLLILYQVFFAMRATGPVLGAGAVMLAGNGLLGWALSGPMGEVGVALAFTVSYAAAAAIALAVFARRTGGLDGAALAGSALRALAASAAMGGLVWALRRWAPGLHVLVLVAAGGAAYALLARVLCPSEWILARKSWSRDDN